MTNWSPSVQMAGSGTEYSSGYCRKFCPSRSPETKKHKCRNDSIAAMGENKSYRLSEIGWTE
jgi:hypothetical protein